MEENSNQKALTLLSTHIQCLLIKDIALGMINQTVLSELCSTSNTLDDKGEDSIFLNKIYHATLTYIKSIS